jgi:hypothetical protein
MSLILDGTNGLSDVDGSAATPAIRGSDANTGVFFGSDVVGLSTGGSERVRVDASGNVGIGTSSPAQKLSVTGNIAATGSIDCGTQFLGLSTDSATAPSFSFTDDTDTGIFRTSANSLGLTTGGTVRLTLSTSALVSTLPFDAPAGTAAAPAFTFSSDTDTGIFRPSTNTLAFTEGGAEAMRIDSSGNLLVGITSNLNNGKVTVRTPTSFTGVGFRSDSSTAASTTWSHFYGTSSGNSVANITIMGNGNITNANNSYGPYSDIKLKENIVDATPKLDKLLQVRIVNYNLKTDPELKQLGVVAQELEQVFPGLVDEHVDKDAEGNDLGTTTKSVKMSVFVPMLIKAIQEQQQIITALTARVEALEGAQA